MDYDPNQLLTVPEAAKILRVSPRTVWRLIRIKKLKSRRIMGATRLKRKDIVDFTDDS